jgi:thiamine pyrophosphokinase
MKVLIIANGEIEEEKIFKYLDLGYFILCLDGAVDFVIRCNCVIIDTVAGDMDSISSDSLRFIKKNKIKIINKNSQNLTDLDFGVSFATSFAESIVIIGAFFKDRMDHTIHNLTFFRKFYNEKVPIMIESKNQIITFARDKTIFLENKANKNIGLFGLPVARVTCSQLLYPLENYKLEIGLTDSSCNTTLEDNIRLDIEGDCLISYEI